MLHVLWESLLLQLCLLSQIYGEQKTEPLAYTKGHNLFWGSDQYDFTIILPGTGLQCFWHYAQENGRFYLTYMVQQLSGLASDRHLSVNILTPQGFLMTSSNDAIGQMNFKTQETGFYQMCFTNIHNTFGSMQVFINFGVYYKGPGEVKKQNGEGRRQLTDTLFDIEDRSNRLQGRVLHMWRYYNFARMKKGVDYYLLLSNFLYVTWWSAAQSTVIVAAGYLQLFFLKRLIQTRRKTYINKPRC